MDIFYLKVLYQFSNTKLRGAMKLVGKDINCDKRHILTAGPILFSQNKLALLKAMNICIGVLKDICCDETYICGGYAVFN